MSSQTVKPLVLVIGGTGRTGQPLVDALLEYGTFRVAILTRPASESKPAVAALKSKGVEVRLGDIKRDSSQQLEESLAGVDVLISLMSAEALLDQKIVFKAAKRAGVKRVVPSDFAFPCPPGVRALHDEKLIIHSFLRDDLHVPYTIIDIGWWMQLTFPHPPSSTGFLADLSHEVYGPGNVKSAVTDRNDIGRFVARIIGDPRTINKHVFCWSEEVTQNEVYELAERVSGLKLSDAKVVVSEDEIRRRAAAGKADYQRDSDAMGFVMWHTYEYAYSRYLRGDNTLENAKTQGALDARELYPDFKPVTLAQFAEEFYRQEQFLI